VLYDRTDVSLFAPFLDDALLVDDPRPPARIALPVRLPGLRWR
jgi:hypothetical protein